MQAQELDCRGFVQWQNVGRKIKKAATPFTYSDRIPLQVNEKEEKETICIGFQLFQCLQLQAQKETRSNHCINLQNCPH